MEIYQKMLNISMQKKQQSLIEGKIADLENAVGRAEIIDVKSIASE